MKVLSIVGTFYLLVGHVMYSLSYPDGINSLFQSNIYKTISGNALAVKFYIFICAKFMDGVGYLMPIKEFKAAHDIIAEFIDPTELYAKSKHLLFVTFHIQVGMGYLGIEFLRAEQGRKNQLVKIEEEVKKSGDGSDSDNAVKMNGTKNKTKTKSTEKKTKQKDASEKFRKSAGPFIFFVALPYMMQIVLYGGMNMYAFHCFRDDIHRAIRLNDLFANNGARFVATATSKESNLSPDAYASNSETVVTTVYEMFNRNLFSLPKLMLIPGIIAKQPMMVVQITPMILFSDWLKSVVVAAITTEVERVNKEVKDVSECLNIIFVCS